MAERQGSSSVDLELFRSVVDTLPAQLSYRVVRPVSWSKEATVELREFNCGGLETSTTMIQSRNARLAELVAEVPTVTRSDARSVI